MNYSRVLILDFGSQVTKLIARKIRELNIYCEILPYKTNIKNIKQISPDCIILSGSPASVHDKNLLLRDAIGQIPSNEIDSLYFLQQYIDKWIRKQLMIYNAEINLTDEMKNYDKQIEEYEKQ